MTSGYTRDAVTLLTHSAVFYTVVPVAVALKRRSARPFSPEHGSPPASDKLSTLLGNDPAADRQFLEETGELMVANLLRPPTVGMDAEDPAAETLSHSPMVFQEPVPKECELRVLNLPIADALLELPSRRQSLT